MYNFLPGSAYAKEMCSLHVEEMREFWKQGNEDFFFWRTNTRGKWEEGGCAGRNTFYSVILCFANIKRKSNSSVICNANSVLMLHRLPCCLSVEISLHTPRYWILLRGSRCLLTNVHWNTLSSNSRQFNVKSGAAFRAECCSSQLQEEGMYCQPNEVLFQSGTMKGVHKVACLYHTKACCQMKLCFW